MLQTAELKWDFWDVSVSTLQPQANVDEVWVTYVTPANFVGVLLSLGWLSPSLRLTQMSPRCAAWCLTDTSREEGELENKALGHEAKLGI